MKQMHTKKAARPAGHTTLRSGRKAKAPTKVTVIVDPDALRLQGLVSAYTRNLAALPARDYRKPAIRKALTRAQAQFRAAQVRARATQPIVATA